MVQELIAEKRILVTRGKDETPRIIFYNDYTDICEMDKGKLRFVVLINFNFELFLKSLKRLGLK